MLSGAGALIKGCFALVLPVKNRLHRALSPISTRQLCHADETHEAETAVHGCHYLLGDMAVPCQTVGWCLSVCLAFIVRKELPLL